MYYMMYNMGMKQREKHYTKTLAFRISEKELSEIRTRSKNARQGVSDYLRDSLRFYFSITKPKIVRGKNETS